MIDLVVPLEDDERLDPVAELSNPSSSLVITPSSYSDFNTMVADNPTITDFILTAGDYRSWAPLFLGTSGNPTGGGTVGRRNVIRYQDLTPPWQRKSNNQAYVPQFQFWDNQYWIVAGLTFNDTSLSRQVFFRQAATNIILHECLFETDQYCVSVYASNCKIQRCYARDQQGDNDSPCFQIATFNNNEPTGNMVLDCEIRNWNDGCVLTDDDADEEIHGTVFAGNDIYCTTDYYHQLSGGEYGEGENAFDIKLGSTTNPTIIENNRCWGFRYSKDFTSNGSFITNHRFSRDLIFRNNICEDGVIGFYENVWPNGFGLSGSRGTQLSGNIFANIRRYSDNDDTGGGVYYAPNMGISVDGDMIYGCWRMAAVENSEVHGAHDINNCSRYITSLSELKDEWNSGALNKTEPIRVRYQRKRLSGPEWKTIGYFEPTEVGKRIFNHVRMTTFKR